MTDTEAEHGHFDLDAGTLCLDFVNTLDGRLDPQPHEFVQGYLDLVTFGLETDSLGAIDARRLTATAEADPSAATAMLCDAIALREALYPIFAAVAEDRTPETTDLDVLNTWVARTTPHGRITATGDGFTWEWQDLAGTTAAPLDRPLWPVVRDASELLLHGDLSRVRMCAAHDCAWLFLDTSRNRSRRWCSMQSCGNRAKVQQFRERRAKVSDEQ
jgi:predicted RNA-binding Zn ribbon-like protein